MVDNPRPWQLVTRRSKWTCARSYFLFFWLILLFFVSSASLVVGQSGNLEPESRAADARAQRIRQEQWFLRGRASPEGSSGQSAAALRYRAYLQKMRMRAQRGSEMRKAGRTILPQDSGKVWSPLGPAPLASDASGSGQEDYNWVSGRATTVVADPNDLTGNTVYLGGAYGGVWKSSNAGPLSQSAANVIWDGSTPLQSLTDNQATLAVGAIAIQPQLTNPNPANSVVVVGTGEANSSADSYYGLGILLSTNAGNTWTLIPSDTTGTRSLAGMAFSKIAFSTATPALAVAATAGASMGILEGLEDPVTANLGIYYSDGSLTDWTFATVQDATNVATAPSSVTSVVYNQGAGEFYAAIRYHGFYSSSDGETWSRLPDQPGAGLTEANCPAQTASPSVCPIYRGEIAAVPGRNEMYVWYVDANDNDQGIWASTDAGTTWSQLDESGITNCGDYYGCGTEQGTYNLTLAAVPNNTATDLYAGAINLYKCTITSIIPNCNGTGSNTFLNLTHVYGCPPDFGSIAHVHPAQHAMSFMLIQGNTQDVMFFANDGGIYRALDGYTGLTTGTCGDSNQFDSLNQTLGSMTQFVSFSQSSTDPEIILGGSQGNGAPATDLALIDSPWQSVNVGDNGYTEIDPDNEDEWFVSNPADAISGVNIFSCASGINCRTPDFQNNQVVSGATLGGDTGAYYPPYILDPQNSGELTVGTCRMWRGSSSGGTYVVLSHSFETGGDGICTGTEINLVRSLAAGGPMVNGLSNVMYAGTDGDGPLIPTSPEGGHVWVSTNVAGGLSTWADQTGSINPNNFPISSIALDNSDATGLTAYVTIMGFNTIDFPTSHVWKTTNGGQSWTDFTANLPDAPANSVLVDASTGTVYVGTDVGVFSRSTASPSWTEVGQSGGYLPNVAVTALGMFENQAGTIKLLRASTYGRGVWQFPLITMPDFVLSVPNNAITVFGSQQAVFQGDAISLFNYASVVNLSCTNGATSPPPTCSVSPSSLTPQSSGTPFTVTAGGPIGDYSFNLHAVGTDQSQTTHNFALTLHVVDFALTAPSPSNVTANVPNSSPPVHFQVTAAGSFNSAVNLSCGGLPVGATCNFQPSDSVNPTPQHPAKVTLTISTSTSTPTGTVPITITGATAGGPDRTQNLSLTVKNAEDYVLVIEKPTSLSAPVTGLATFNGTLTSLGNYDSMVDLSCSAGQTAPPANCTPNPTSLIPGANGKPFTVTVKSSVVQAYNFNITAVGTDPSHTRHAFSVTFTAAFDFSLTNVSSPQSIPAGQTATYDLDVKPLGSNFPDSVTFSCSGLPGESTCSFSPAQIVSGKGDTPVTFTITTTAPILASARPPNMPRLPLYALWLPLPGLLLLFDPRELMRSRRKHLSVLFLLVALAFAILMVACGGGASSSGGSGQPGTNPGTYTVNVTAVSGSLTRSTPVTLTVN